jgi:hypothetical protein
MQRDKGRIQPSLHAVTVHHLQTARKHTYSNICFRDRFKDSIEELMEASEPVTLNTAT